MGLETVTQYDIFRRQFGEDLQVPSDLLWGEIPAYMHRVTHARMFIAAWLVMGNNVHTSSGGTDGSAHTRRVTMVKTHGLECVAHERVTRRFCSRAKHDDGHAQ